ncbi:MAG: CotH kinase family protein [Candidatus Sericytochromatia bacterium]
MRFNDKTWNHVGLRFKGNSSLASSWNRTLKLPLRLDFEQFETEYPDSKDQRFYGFKELSLSSGFSDNSLIHEKAAADIFRAAGLPEAQTAFYRIYVDYGEGSKYFGLYTMVEIPDKPMLLQQFGNADGNLYKPEGNGAKFVSFDEKSFEKKSNKTTSDWNDIKAIFSALNAPRTDAAKWRAGLEKVFAVDEYLTWLGVNTLIENWDTYGRMSHNFYLYHNPKDGLVHWITWDHNMSLTSRGGPGGPGGPGMGFPGMPIPGSAVSPVPAINPSANPSNNPGVLPPPGGGRGGGAPSLELSVNEIDSSWPLIRFLIDDPVYHAKYVAAIAKAMNGGFAIVPTKAMYQKWHTLISPYVVGPEGEQKDATLLTNEAAFT